MIEVQSLTRRYGKTAAVDDVSFSIERNEIVGLLGHNGAGKTTIMRMLSGYLEPCAGSIRSAGSTWLTRPTRVYRQQLGYLPENLPVYPDMMVADYLEYAATLKGIPAERRYRRYTRRTGRYRPGRARAGSDRRPVARPETAGGSGAGDSGKAQPADPR